MSAWGRLRQVWYYLRPRWSPGERAWAAERLTPAQLALFDAMAVPDRAHALRVARRLAREGAPAWVLEAALLHDCGKPADYGLAARSLGVLLDRLAGDVSGEPGVRGVRRWLQIYRWHDRWGLEAARAAGTSAEAIALLTAYQLGAHGEGAPPWLGPLLRCDDLG